MGLSLEVEDDFSSWAWSEGCPGRRSAGDKHSGWRTCGKQEVVCWSCGTGGGRALSGAARRVISYIVRERFKR